MRALIILLFLCLSTTGHADHSQTFAEFEARETLMQLQMNLWELLDQLYYATGELRVQVLTEIHDMQKRISEQIYNLVVLDEQHHGK